MESAILSFPGSEGLVNVRPMLDYLWRVFPRASREAFIDDVGKSLAKLRRLGDLYLERQYGIERRAVTVGEWEDFGLLNFVVWDSASQQWAVSTRQAGVDDILIQLSQGGINDLQQYDAQNKKSGMESE